MGLFPVVGAKYVGSDQVPPDQQGKVEQDKNFDETLLEKKYTKDTFHNRTALNHSRLDPVIKKLENYTEGSPIKVLYFSNITNYASKQSATSDYSYNLNNVHKAYDKINNLEIRLNGGFEYSYDEDNHEASVEGVGKINSGFKAIVGDIFLYEVYPGQIGLFLVSNTNPLALHRTSSHEISFVLKEYVDNIVIENLEKCVVNTYFYDTQKIMGETTTLLKRQDHFDLLKITNMRKDLIDVFINLFYSKRNESLFRPDELYDPYIVKFLNEQLAFNDSPYYPFVQLCNNYEYNRNSILNDLLNGEQALNLDRIDKYQITRKAFNIMSANINGLHNKDFVELDTLGEKWYCFSELFYNKDITNVLMTDLEKYVLNYLSTKTIDVGVLVALVENVKNLERIDMFYQVPILIFLCNQAISNF